MEKDFATNAYWKYFTYDTFDPRTWVTLNDLESCLRTVKGGTVNPWVGADDLWEANVLPLGGHEKMTSQKLGVVFFFFRRDERWCSDRDLSFLFLLGRGGRDVKLWDICDIGSWNGEAFMQHFPH